MLESDGNTRGILASLRRHRSNNDGADVSVHLVRRDFAALDGILTNELNVESRNYHRHSGRESPQRSIRQVSEFTSEGSLGMDADTRAYHLWEEQQPLPIWIIPPQEHVLCLGRVLVSNIML